MKYKTDPLWMLDKKCVKNSQNHFWDWGMLDIQLGINYNFHRNNKSRELVL